MRGQIIDHVRARRTAVPLEAVAEALPGAGDLLGDLLAREQRDLVVDQIAALPAEARELLALRYADGLSHAEIAALLGLRPDAVKQRVSRTLRELRTRLHGAAGKGAAEYVV